MKAWFKFVIPVVWIAFIVTGCSFGGSDKGFDKKQESTLRVMYYDENSFFQEYGMLFSALYPNVNVEVVSTQSMYNNGEVKDYDAALTKFIDEEKPDILMLGSDQYKQMAQDGKLYDLESEMAKSKYDTEGLVPGLLDYMREQGGGKIYAFTPGFYSQVLYYNKDLFDKFQIEYPTDQMSWNEVLQLARRFPTDGDKDTRLYGLKMSYNDDLFQIATTLTSADGLTYVNPAQKQMTINSQSWKAAFQTAADAIHSDSLFFESKMYENQNVSDGITTYGGSSNDHYLMRDPFIANRLAMSIGDSGFLSQIKQANEITSIKDRIIKNWDMVTVPVGQQNPDQSNMISLNNYLSISADSPNKEAAWEFLKYITSDDYARVKSKAGSYGGLTVRTKYISDTEGHNFAAFYKLKPSSTNMYRDYDKLPQTFWMDFQNAMTEEMQKVKDEKQTIDEALEIMQTKGQEFLAKEDPADQKEAEPSTDGVQVEAETP